MGPYEGRNLEEVNRTFVIRELTYKIKSLDWHEARNDVERFLRAEELATLKLWEKGLFLEKIGKII